ncbi:A24 family peptidase [Dactylosporangium sp. AC04546]|uniref:prepilin peptidase n=1 Tax=Dactylosporangium sp. AC04546 TaxID=2862460 RepID=UPI001EDD76CF|nr:A24 family peptidase [Dactylosporangium sp. AC04546]WVK80420.1 A24 family peptidase [Dactylosporangium sp. AC04546]
MGAAFAALTMSVDALLPLLAYCFVAAVGITLAAVDVAVHRLPNRLTVLLAIGTTTLFAIHAAAADDSRQLLESVASGAGMALSYVLMSSLTGGGIGLGDAKLALGLGIAAGWLGWRSTLVAGMLGLLLTGLAAVALLLLGRAGRGDSIPHGPFMVLATLGTVVLMHA